MAERVVVTGLGVVGPLGVGAEATFEGLLAGRSGVGRIAAFDPSGFDSQIGGEVRDVKVRDYIPKAYRKRIQLMARDIELAVVAAYDAAVDAGVHTRCLVECGKAEAVNVDPTRLGANIGAGLICADLTELAGALSTAAPDGQFSLTEWGRGGMENLTPLWLLKFLPNMLACHVTIIHDCQGPSNTITCGEASGHLAVGEAMRMIQRGAADAILCGGAESKINPMGLIRQSLLKRLVTDGNDDPATACRPFAADRRGTVISEGGGLLMLESLTHAQQRGARIYAEMLGFGASCNPGGWQGPAADGSDVALAVAKALAEADVAPDAVDLLAPSGVGLLDGDLAEARGLHAALGDRAGQVHALAIKGATGNNGAGSSPIDLAMAVMAMHRGVLPPSPNTQPMDPACNLRTVAEGPVDGEFGTAVSTSYALNGGQCAAFVLRRWTS